jgi:hypothetical protein
MPGRVGPNTAPCREAELHKNAIARNGLDESYVECEALRAELVRMGAERPARNRIWIDRPGAPSMTKGAAT